MPARDPGPQRAGARCRRYQHQGRSAGTAAGRPDSPRVGVLCRLGIAGSAINARAAPYPRIHSPSCIVWEVKHVRREPTGVEATLLQLDLIQTLAFGGLALFVGHGACRAIPLLARYNLPSPIIGGLLVAVAALVARGQGVTLFQFDTTLQSPLMIAFFTSIGLSASLSLLRVGGPQVMLLFGIATVFALIQNVVGAALASSFGLSPLLGVLAGSVTLTGGPATGLAFAPLFEQAGISGAGSIAVAMAMAGIVSGGLIGGPVSTFLIERHRLVRSGGAYIRSAGELRSAPASTGSDANDDEYVALKTIVVMLVAMWAGSWVSKGCAALGLTLPATIGAMLAGAVIRNLDDATGWIGLSQRTIENVGSVALSLFLVMALMTLDLSESGRARRCRSSRSSCCKFCSSPSCAAGRCFR